MKTTVNTNTKIHTRLIPFILLNLAFMPALAGEIIDETRDVDPNEVVDIELINGHITIIGWDRNQIQIKGELSDQA
jgi:hypothetical protein